MKYEVCISNEQTTVECDPILYAIYYKRDCKEVHESNNSSYSWELGLCFFACFIVQFLHFPLVLQWTCVNFILYYVACPPL